MYLSWYQESRLVRRCVEFSSVILRSSSEFRTSVGFLLPMTSPYLTTSRDVSPQKLNKSAQTLVVLDRVWQTVDSAGLILYNTGDWNFILQHSIIYCCEFKLALLTSGPHFPFDTRDKANAATFGVWRLTVKFLHARRL